jgi:D-glycero-D-manno-heptose 1,7-bisphosphate phosphatase
MQKAIFLDRDGTINFDKNYLFKKEDFEFLPRVIDGLRLLQDAGYLIIIITNQSGIARGYFTEADFINLNDWMLLQFNKNGINIAKVYYCPHLPNAAIEKYRAKCTCRKPQIGMFLRAILDFDIDISNSYTIGDKIRDCAICETTDCKGFLVSNSEDPEIIQKVKNGSVSRVRYATDVYECSQIIIDESHTKWESID